MKKLILYSICIMPLVLMGFKMFDEVEEVVIPKNEKVVNNLFGELERSLVSKYSIPVVATVVSMPGGVVKLLGLEFQINEPIGKDQIRGLLLKISKDFVSIVQNDKDLIPYLETKPFTIKNLEITLFIRDFDGRELDDPEIGIASIIKGGLEYWTLITTDTRVVKRIEKESYEDALKELKMQQKGAVSYGIPH